MQAGNKAVFIGFLIFGAGIDVFEKEPPDTNNLLLKNEKVFLSPHVSTFTEECIERMGMEVVQNIIDFFDNKLEESKIKNPRVGTIDKFQGQEAPVTIISMTSSDSDSLPRNKEFFFSRNRLNVAISRAQVASIILFNPNLLDSSPKNLDQIKLMNNFFKLLNYKI